jgi:nucleoside-diphosphate-sugar epimerase
MDDNRPYILIDELRARWLWTRGYVENIAAAIALVLTDKRASGKIYNVGEKTTLSEADWVRSIAKYADWDGEIVTMPFDSLPEHLRADYEFAQHMECDTSQMRDELGFDDPVSFAEGMIKTIAWERTNPPDKIDAKDFDYDKEDEALKEFQQN